MFATLLIGLPAVWVGFALWYRAPGGQVIKTLSVAVWAALTLATFTALVGLVVDAVAFAEAFVLMAATAGVE